jgi:hypothetical protein
MLIVNAPVYHDGDSWHSTSYKNLIFIDTSGQEWQLTSVIYDAELYLGSFPYQATGVELVMFLRTRDAASN